MAKHNFREIKAWQKAKSLPPIVYALTSNFPNEERYALTSQVKRAVVSISSNIAEGSGRKTTKYFSYFLDIAIGSAIELESEILVAFELDFINENDCKEVFTELDEVQKLIIGFQNYINKF